MPLHTLTAVYIDSNGTPAEASFEEHHSPQAGTRVAIFDPDTTRLITTQAYDNTVAAFGKLDDGVKDIYRDEIKHRAPDESSRYQDMNDEQRAAYLAALEKVGLNRTEASKRIVADHELYGGAAKQEGVFSVNGHPVRGREMASITQVTFWMGQVNAYDASRLVYSIKHGRNIAELTRTVQQTVPNATQECAAASIAKAAPLINKIRISSGSPKF